MTFFLRIYTPTEEDFDSKIIIKIKLEDNNEIQLISEKVIKYPLKRDVVLLKDGKTIKFEEYEKEGGKENEEKGKKGTRDEKKTKARRSLKQVLYISS